MWLLSALKNYQLERQAQSQKEERRILIEVQTVRKQPNHLMRKLKCTKRQLLLKKH